MKLFATIFLLVFALASALASIEPQDLTVQRDVTSGTLIFRSTVALPQTAAFEITDAYGNLIYTDSITKGNFLNKRFKEVVFTASSYTVIITDKVGQTSLPLKVNAKGDITNTAKANHLIFPTMNFRSDRTLVVAYNNKKGQRVDIKIANHRGETIFKDQVSGSESTHRAYQLDNLQSGDYQLIVSSRGVKNHTTAFALR